MLISMSWALTILFELVLFVLLLFIGKKLVYNQVLPYLFEQIKAIKQYWKNLSSKKNLVFSTQKAVEKTIKEQEKYIKTLDKKIKIWHSKQLEKIENKEQEHNTIKSILRRKKKEQKQQIHLLKLNQEVIPHALELAQKELQKQYAGVKGKKILNELITKI